MRIVARNRQTAARIRHAEPQNRNEIRVVPYSASGIQKQDAISQTNHVNMYGNRITKLGDPTSDGDAVNVKYLQTRLNTFNDSIRTAYVDHVNATDTVINNRCIARSKNILFARCAVEVSGEVSFFKPGAFNPAACGVIFHCCVSGAEKIGQMTLHTRALNSANSTAKVLVQKSKNDAFVEYQPITLESNIFYWLTMSGSSPSACLTAVLSF